MWRVGRDFGIWTQPWRIWAKKSLSSRCRTLDLFYLNNRALKYKTKSSDGHQNLFHQIVKDMPSNEKYILGIINQKALQTSCRIVGLWIIRDDPPRPGYFTGEKTEMHSLIYEWSSLKPRKLPQVRCILYYIMQLFKQVYFYLFIQKYSPTDRDWGNEILISLTNSKSV